MSVADIPAAPPATGFARRHAWLAVLVVGAALFIAEERALVATQNPNLVPSAILLGASIVPLGFVAFVYGRRLPYRVPGIAVAASAFLGGVIGAPAGFVGAPELRIGRNHFRDRVTCAQPLAQLPERAIGDARHRRDGEVVRQCIRSDAHDRRRRT